MQYHGRGKGRGFINDGVLQRLIPVTQLPETQLILKPRLGEKLDAFHQTALHIAHIKRLKAEAMPLIARLNPQQKQIIDANISKPDFVEQPDRYFSEAGQATPEFALKLFSYLLIIILLLNLVACTGTPSTPPVDNQPSIGIVADPTEEAEPVAAPPAVTVEAENPDAVEEEAGTPPNPEIVVTPITPEAVVTAIATSEFNITLTPEAVEKLNNDISIAYDSGFAYIATRNPNGPLEIKRVVAAKQASVSEDGNTITFEDSAGNTTATIDLATGIIEVTPPAVPAPVPTEEEEETEEPPVEEEETPPVEDQLDIPESPFTPEQLSTLENRWPMQFNADSGYMGSAEVLRGEQNIQFVDIIIGNLNPKIISNIHYIDANGVEQGVNNKIWVVDAGMANVDGSWYMFYGQRTNYWVPIESPDRVLPQTLIDWLNQYLREVAGPDYEYGSKGEMLQLTFTNGANQEIENGLNDPNGMSDFATYGSGFASDHDLTEFYATGDPSLLPTWPEGTLLPDGTDISGQSYLPTLRLMPTFR